ncbi:MAG: radical SAM protein [Verrucomicrobiae bacterium]|nr:radical SAM protein [Verrucomicrobiae bacterium]
MAILKYLKRGGTRVLDTVRAGDLRSTVKMFRLYGQALRKEPEGVCLPNEIQFEVSNICNLHCPMCSYSRNDTEARRSLLSRETFHAVLDQLPDLRAINLTGLGESLLNPDLAHFVEHASRRGIRTAMISNGLLFNAGKTETLAAAGLVTLGLSIESGLEEAYAARRLGGSLEKFKAALEVLRQARRSRAPCFSVSFNVLLTPENVNDPAHIRSILDLAKAHEIPEISFQNPHDMKQHFGEPYSPAFAARLAALFCQVSERAQAVSITCHFPSMERARNCCYYPWVYPYITALGEVLPCCVIPQFGDYQTIVRELSFGNAITTPLAEIWNGEKAVAFRRSLGRGQPHPYCLRCSKYWNIL